MHVNIIEITTQTSQMKLTQVEVVVLSVTNGEQEDDGVDDGYNDGNVSIRRYDTLAFHGEELVASRGTYA